jgi:hypothetical protein
VNTKPEPESIVPLNHADEIHSEWAISGIQQVLSSGEIRRIVCVDDAFTDAGTVDRDAIIAAVSAGDVPGTLLREVAQEVLRENGEDVASYLVEDGDSEAQAQWLRENRDDVSDDRWSRLADAAPEKREDAITTRDAETLQQLRGFADAMSLEFFPLNLDGWREKGEQILGEEGCTLIFFDRNLSSNGGSDTQGEGLLAAAVREHPPESVIAVLFTHAVTALNEYDQWLAMSSADPALKDRVLVIAKDRMREDHIGFASELKMAILAPRLRRIATLVSTGFTKLASRAAARIVEFSPHLLHSVLVSSVEKEGAWGPDGLVGIASAYLRQWLEAYVRADEEVRSDVSKIRELSLKSRDIALPAGEADEYSRINRVRMFDEPEHVNELRLPIDTGDIFAFFNPSQPVEGQSPNSFWVLVLQRCDVTVRGDGRRAYDPKLMPLAHIVRPRDRDHASGAALIGRILLHSSPLSGHVASEVNLQDRIFVPSIALDACALNEDGVARLSVSAELDMDGLIPAWVELGKRHWAWGERKLEAYRQMHEGIGHLADARVLAAITSALTGTARDTCGFTSHVDVGNKSILFGVRRVARLREPHSQDLMERFGALWSRIPLDVVLSEKG